MKSVLISIQPKWCELIASGKKTVEVRKTKPKLETPFKCYIYATWNSNSREILVKEGKAIFTADYRTMAKRASGRVIGEFVCDRIRGEYEIADGLVDIVLESTSCVGARELLEYANGKPLYSWHISNLVIYKQPKELSEFSKHGFDRFVPWKRPPQSWGYCEERSE